jgi:hypothetical protein
MTSHMTRAERLDRAVDEVLEGTTPGIAAASVGLDASDRPLVRTAASLRAALAGPLVAPRFEARLGARLAGVDGQPWILRHPARLIVTGAVGSAVGVGVTAYAFWRSSRRSGSAARLVHR